MRCLALLRANRNVRCECVLTPSRDGALLLPYRKALEKAMKQFPVGTAKRWEVIADVLGTGRTGDAVADFAKHHAARAASQGADAYAAFLASRKGSAEVVADGGASTRETSFTDVTVGGAGDTWTEAEDMALLAAMKAHPKDASGGDDKARWVAIAWDVPGGKTPAQCVKRVAALKDQMKPKQQQQQQQQQQ